MSEPKVLYSASGRTGEHYKDVVKAEELSEEEYSALNPYIEYKIQMYMKVGLYCNWSWKDFCETPYPVIKYISDEMDFRLEHSDSSIFSWQMLAFFLAVSRLFSGSKGQN